MLLSSQALISQAYVADTPTCYETVGFLMGSTYSNASVKIDGELDIIDITYGYNGEFTGMHFDF
ncbi:MAG: hypothetical protein BMS9Abin19_0197 [Gammaproteobacteria bacterium]|nr:MAG: hypothetical protein BMS9Abin19_0197 [Gammaproteobacteria bacterium]